MTKKADDFIATFHSRTRRFAVIPPTAEAVSEFGTGCGCEVLVISRKDIHALLDGKAWAFAVNEGEYTHFVIMKQEKQKGQVP